MLQVTTEGYVTWLIFDRPERLNSFTAADYHDLHVALDTAAGDPATRVIVLSGTGRAFSAGADKSLLDPTSLSADRARAGEEFDALLVALRSCEKPLLAAVNGLAVGFGCTILLYCDLALAAESARFRLPFTALRLVPEAGSTMLLPSRGRMDEAMWAMLSSDWLDANAGRELGIVWRVVADSSLREQTVVVAETIAQHDPASVAATKRLLTAGQADAARRAVSRELDEMERLHLWFNGPRSR